MSQRPSVLITIRFASLTTCLVSLLFLLVQAGIAAIAWEESYQAAQEKAAKEGKLLLLDFFHPR